MVKLTKSGATALRMFPAAKSPIRLRSNVRRVMRAARTAMIGAPMTTPSA
jgi:hypothetical protein